MTFYLHLHNPYPPLVVICFCRCHIVRKSIRQTETNTTHDDLFGQFMRPYNVDKTQNISSYVLGHGEWMLSLCFPRFHLNWCFFHHFVFAAVVRIYRPTDTLWSISTKALSQVYYIVISLPYRQTYGQTLDCLKGFSWNIYPLVVSCMIHWAGCIVFYANWDVVVGIVGVMVAPLPQLRY